MQLIVFIVFLLSNPKGLSTLVMKSSPKKDLQIGSMHLKASKIILVVMVVGTTLASSIMMIIIIKDKVWQVTLLDQARNQKKCIRFV